MLTLWNENRPTLSLSVGNRVSLHSSSFSLSLLRHGEGHHDVCDGTVSMGGGGVLYGFYHL